MRHDANLKNFNADQQIKKNTRKTLGNPRKTQLKRKIGSRRR